MHVQAAARDTVEPIRVNADDLQAYMGQAPFTSDRIYDSSHSLRPYI